MNVGELGPVHVCCGAYPGHRDDCTAGDMTERTESFTCPCCGKVSHHPSDLEHGYCGACHWWTGDPVLGPPHLADPCEMRADRLERGDDLP